MSRKPLTIMLDSGAFSAWNKGVSIDLDAYIQFIKDSAEWIDFYVNLDVIPGEFGRIPSLVEVEESAQKSWDNFLYMQEFSLNPIPVYHMGEDSKWLKRMLDHGCEYIGISPANDRSTKEKIFWLDRVFEMLVDSKRAPIVKTHAFGVTNVSIMRRYPWYSVDSSAWSKTAGLGSVFIPKFDKHGTPKFTHSPTTVVFSTKQKTHAKNSFHVFPEKIQTQIRKYVESKGENLESLFTDYAPRCRMNVHFFEGVVDQIHKDGLDKIFHKKRSMFFEEV